jgi:hypothetical protein
MLRGQEVEAAFQEDERWRRHDNRGDRTTSWRTRGRWEGRRSQTRGGGLSIGREAAAVQREAS